MFRSRTPRSAVAAALSIVLIAAFMVGTTSAAASQQGERPCSGSGAQAEAVPDAHPDARPRRRRPRRRRRTPTTGPSTSATRQPSPDGDGRTRSDDGHRGQHVRVHLFIENDGNQRLTHSEVGVRQSCRSRVRDRTRACRPARHLSRRRQLERGSDVHDRRRTMLGALCELGQLRCGRGGDARVHRQRSERGRHHHARMRPSRSPRTCPIRAPTATRSSPTPASRSARRTRTRTRPTRLAGDDSRCRRAERIRWSRRTR